MTDWAQGQDTSRIVISTFSPESVGIDILTSALAAPAVAAVPSANVAMFVPVIIPVHVTVSQMLLSIGLQSGNFDVGIYDDQGNKIYSKGSTAVSTLTSNATSAVAITSTMLKPGIYYLALSCDNTSATWMRVTANVNGIMGAMGLLQQAAFLLQSPATFAKYAQPYVPYIGLTGRTLV